MSSSPLQQISTDLQPTGSDAPTPAITEAAEDSKPVTDEKPNTPDPEEQQGTDEPQTEAQENDTQPEVIKVDHKSVCVWWWCPLDL